MNTNGRELKSGPTLSRALRAVCVALFLAGCASGKVEVRTDAPQRERVRAAVAEAERLTGRKLRDDLSVGFADGDRKIAVRDVHGRGRKLWVKQVNGGYRAALNYRNFITVYTRPGDPAAWDADVLIHEVGHTLLSGSEAEDHEAMKRMGFAF